ncbi:hypothetical protein AGOR_G00100450 [Albula goreensis]|uniref:Uncharacterized protein n=1 Tax=Albula goreensis TaxID=1534307 RepID=A0A8T3DRR3_9TELE|nr:hypothetical protein AGOR_G00100450 [Albula goreensis]
MFCEDSGVASSPDERLGSSVGSHEDARLDSDKEGFDKILGSGESTGSTPTRSPINPNRTNDSYITYSSSNPTVKSEASYLHTQDNIKAMDATSQGTFASKTSWYDTELAGKDDDDDFLLEMKTASTAKNPFQEFSPISHSGSGFSQYGDMGSDSRAVKMSESPTPDLVQYAHDDMQEATLAKHKEETHFDLVQMGSDAVTEPSKPSVPVSLKEPEDSPAQPSLPDILESSPLSSGKMDSDLSEGSPDSEQSPIQEIRMETHHIPVKHSPTNPFAFDADPKTSALKNVTVETGAKGAGMAGHTGLSGLEKSFGAFDLVKEVDRHETVPYMNLPTSVPSKAAPEDSDSDSPNTDSLSPVLEAMAKNPASFQVEVEKNARDSKVPPVKEAKDFLGSRTFADEPEASEEEGFEQEVSSEEFEIIERPPKGAMDEFIEKMDAKFARAPEAGAGDDRDVLSNFRQEKLYADVGSEFDKASSQQSSYTLLAQPSSSAPSQIFGAELGNPFAPKSQVKEETSVSQSNPPHLTGEATKKPAPSQKMGENIEAALPDTSKSTWLPNLSVGTGKLCMGVP